MVTKWVTDKNKSQERAVGGLPPPEPQLPPSPERTGRSPGARLTSARLSSVPLPKQLVEPAPQTLCRGVLLCARVTNWQTERGGVPRQATGKEQPRKEQRSESRAAWPQTCRL